MNWMNYQKKIKQKWLPKYLINKFSIINGANYFSSEIFQNELVFTPAKKINQIF